jgi:hypothetical protein
MVGSIVNTLVEKFIMDSKIRDSFISDFFLLTNGLNIPALPKNKHKTLPRL